MEWKANLVVALMLSRQKIIIVVIAVAVVVLFNIKLHTKKIRIETADDDVKI